MRPRISCRWPRSRTRRGKYVLPSTAGTTASIDAFKDQLAKDPRTPIANPPASAPDAYPISTLTFLIIPKDGKDVAKRTALKQFILYVVTDGQQAAGGLNYAPLPDAVKQQNVQTLNQMTVERQPDSVSIGLVQDETASSAALG